MRETRSDRCDLLVVGGGVAGLAAALTAADAGAEVLVLAKGPVQVTTSYLAQGGIAAAVGEDDDPRLHAEDAVRAGRGLCRPSAVDLLIEDAPDRVDELRRRGVDFDSGFSLEGGHSRSRVLHCDGAATGAHVARVLGRQVARHSRIRVAQGERAVSLRTVGGRCVGAVTSSRALAARAVLLATGGDAAPLGA